jgi:hypothetical protein
MAGEIFIAITSLRSALDIAKAMVSLRDAETVRAKSIELQGIILKALNESIEAREAYAAQIDRVRALETEVADLKKWDAEKERYELKTVGIGAVAYMLKPEARGSEAPHWLCPTCFAQDKKSFFQGTPATEASHRFYLCRSCKGTIMGETPHWID